jgi:hypothetical protein
LLQKEESAINPLAERFDNCCRKILRLPIRSIKEIQKEVYEFAAAHSENLMLIKINCCCCLSWVDGTVLDTNL